MKHFFFTAAFLAALLPSPAFADAASMPMHPPEATVTVTGEGMLSKSPDEARLFVRIVTDDTNATASSSKNNDIYNAFVSRLNSLRLPSDAVRTTGYDVSFIPYPPKNLPPQERQPRYGYITTRSLSITIAPLGLVGKVIDTATGAGVTDIGDVSFDLKDRHAAYLGALGAAMADAKQQAQTLSSAGGFHLVEIRTVSTSYNAGPLPVRFEMAQMRMAENVAPAPATPTEITSSGPIDVGARVTVTYVIRSQ